MNRLGPRQQELSTRDHEQRITQSNALARAFRDKGVGVRDGVAIMCRNHRYFIEATMACSKLGGVALYLNTAFAGPQLADVMERESPSVLIYDQEFTDLLSEVSLQRFVAWEEEEGTDETTVEQLTSGSSVMRCMTSKVWPLSHRYS